MTPQPLEPPGADPHAGWCGRGGAARLPPIPIVHRVDSTEAGEWDASFWPRIVSRAEVAPAPERAGHQVGGGILTLTFWSGAVL